MTAYLAHATDTRKDEPFPEDLARPLIEAAERGNPAVSTHADLHMENFMLGDDGTVVIIDWECWGWCSAYWERAIMLKGPNPEDWSDAVGQILSESSGASSDKVQAVVRVNDWVAKRLKSPQGPGASDPPVPDAWDTQEAAAWDP